MYARPDEYVQQRSLWWNRKCNSGLSRLVTQSVSKFFPKILISQLHHIASNAIEQRFHLLGSWSCLELASLVRPMMLPSLGGMRLSAHMFISHWRPP